MDVCVEDTLQHSGETLKISSNVPYNDISSGSNSITKDQFAVDCSIGIILLSASMISRLGQNIQSSLLACIA